MSLPSTQDTKLEQSHPEVGLLGPPYTYLCPAYCSASARIADPLALPFPDAPLLPNAMVSVSETLRFPCSSAVTVAAIVAPLIPEKRTRPPTAQYATEAPLTAIGGLLSA